MREVMDSSAKGVVGTLAAMSTTVLASLDGLKESLQIAGILGGLVIMLMTIVSLRYDIRRKKRDAERDRWHRTRRDEEGDA